MDKPSYKRDDNFYNITAEESILQLPKHGRPVSKMNRSLRARAFAMHCHGPRYGVHSHDAQLQIELEKFKSIGLGVDDIQNEEQQWEGMQSLKAVCRPMRIKKDLRKILFSAKVLGVGGIQAYVYRTKQTYMKMKLIWREIKLFLAIWHSSLHWIEGCQGTGVLSYFIFLRWMLGLNFVVAMLLMCFIIVPMGNMPVLNYFKFFNESSVYLSYKCSLAYYHKNETSSSSGKRMITDFFQGTGWMENTFMFYGFYTDTSLFSWTGTFDIKNYNLSLAYILVTFFSFLLCLILMAKRTAMVFEETVGVQGSYSLLCNTVFGSWDFAVVGYANTLIQHKSLCNAFVGYLNEQRFKWLHAGIMSSYSSMFSLYSKRIAVNLLVFGCLGGSAFLIYNVTHWSSTYKNDKEEATFLLIVQFLPSVVLTVLNAGIPVVFDSIVVVEHYTHAVVIKLTLVRTVFLRLATIAVVVTTLYMQIICDTKNACGTGIKKCPPIQCWETYVGQQFHKLMILNFFVTVFKVFYYEIPRRVITTKSQDKCLKKIAPCQFDIAQNVLDLIYTQTIVWLGFFFAPMLPFFSIIHIIFVFYSKMLSALYACDPSDTLYRASRSNSFFVFVLMLTYFLCVLPLGYTITTLPPSKGCGPFRTQSSVLKILEDTMNSMPESLRQIYKMITSASFIICLLTMLFLLLYYCAKHASAHENNSFYLQEELAMEGKAKQVLLSRIDNLVSRSPKTFAETEKELEMKRAARKEARNALVLRQLKKASEKENERKSGKTVKKIFCKTTKTSDDTFAGRAGAEQIVHKTAERVPGSSVEPQTSYRIPSSLEDPHTSYRIPKSSVEPITSRRLRTATEVNVNQDTQGMATDELLLMWHRLLYDEK